MRTEIVLILYQFIHISAQGITPSRRDISTNERWINRREERDCDLSLAIPENENESTIISNISLSRDERVQPVSIWPFTVFLNGTIEIAPRLNYEKTKEHSMTIRIQTNRGDNGRSCNLRVEVIDRVENIHFVNSPRPFLAVVPLQPPLGLHIYKFDARYEDSATSSPSIQYHLINQEPDGFFSVDSSSGIVRTLKRDYERGETFRLFVEAVDYSDKGTNKSKNGNVAVLEILSDDRSPQFLSASYEVEVAEDTVIDTSIIDVKAISFRSIDGNPKESIQYSIKDWEDSARFFRIDPSTGIVYLDRPVDYEDNSMSRLHHLNVIADEGNLRSTVPLNIKITDINDSIPKLTQPLYSAHVPEDIPVGKTILRVEASDADSGQNGKIAYSINSPLFNINENGEISAKSRLDADETREGSSVYRLIVTVRDYGVPSLSSTTKVYIRVENRNDEQPLFIPTSSYTAFVAEDAQGGTPVVQIQARDPDGDQIIYSLLNEDSEESLHTRLLSIDKDTGVLRLREGVNGQRLQREGSPLNVTIVATDDGSCCVKREGEERVVHSSYAIVRIAIEARQDNKPVFTECVEYSKRAKLKEGQYRNGKTVDIIQVVAEDKDTGMNGQIIYSLYHSQSDQRKPFVINPHSGILSPSPHVIFDRETRSREEVTVKAVDNGDRPLVSFCSFSVEIEDVNDNSPTFDRDSYTASISRHTSAGTSILNVVATDNDAPVNARITYSLGVDSVAGDEHIDDVNYVQLLTPTKGEIMLTRAVDDNTKSELRFIVSANDNGEGGSLSSSSTVTIVIHNSEQEAPQWISKDDCPARVLVKENMGMNVVLARCLATTTTRTQNIMYKMTVSGETTTSKFRHFTRRHRGEEWMEISMMEPLDYETAHNYTITLIATDMTTYVSSSRELIVEVEDVNDSVPKSIIDLFTGTIDENLTPDQYERVNNGIPIVTVHATDADSPGPKSEVFYRILSLDENDDGSKFRIDPKTGEIYPLEILDREIKDELIITVEARDNSASSLPGVTGFNTDTIKVKVLVNDMNDCVPFFPYEEYMATVREDAPIGQILLTLNAEDKDKNSKLRYEIGNADSSARLAFGIETETGRVFVKEKLDYETRENHSLIVTALDGSFNATTRLIVLVEDVNDCPPQFTQSLYEITMKEEDADIPKVILRVTATDRDKATTNGGIVYDIAGQGVGDHFSIHPHTGEISVVSSLDRDPPKGLPTWKMVVQASDTNGSGLVGYADVQINLIDLNDNSPFFPSNLFGYIDENREPQTSEGVFVMRVEATDLDDPFTHNGRLTYSIKKNKEIEGNPIFTIQPASGKIFAMRALDHEGSGENQMVITVVATDGGVPQLSNEANVTIFIRDVNDNVPMFKQKSYEGRVRENTPIHSAVLTLSAVDEDKDDPENILTYSLGEENPFFYMTTESDSSGSSVGVIRVKEILDYEERSGNEGISLSVLVSDGIHEGQTTANIYIVDTNDGHPIIEGIKEISISEGLPPASILTRFTVRDHDEGDSARFRINRQTDPKRQFTIDQDGVLKTANLLDREDIPKYTLLIEAFDNAGNVGSQMVAVYLMDENDNGPIPYTVPDPCIFMENLPVEAQQPCEIRAIDRDTQEYGPPFKMELDSTKWKYAQFLNVTFDQNGDGGNGSMSVIPLVVLDREAPFPGKVLEVPLNLWDKAGKMNHHSVFIIVGDENDNPMHDGHTAITVNSYLGKLGKTKIGRVYVEDLDDWDLGDKTFTWKNSAPGFEVSTSGELTMGAEMPPGRYEMSVAVHDNRRNEDAVGSVTVIVHEVVKEAFLKQGSLQVLLSPDTSLASPSDFFRVNSSGVSLMDIFKQEMNSYLGGNTVVDVFSVQASTATLQTADVPVLNIRFSAHGSPFRSSEMLNGLVSANRDSLESSMGVIVVGVGIDMCKFTRCDNGCETIHEAHESSGIVVAANSTVFVGVNATSHDSCECPIWKAPSQCEAGLCHNDAVCHNMQPGFYCECRNELVRGSRCGGTTRSFGGDSFAWYKPLPACTALTLSFDFMTQSPDGVLLYNGAFEGSSSQFQIEYGDYLAIQLRGGRVVLDMVMNGESKNSIEVKGSRLDDGKWHTVAVRQQGRLIELVVDECRFLSPSGGKEEEETCRAVITTQDDDERLNVVAPLQLGGLYPLGGLRRYPQSISAPGYKGCIRTVIINDEEIDLATPAYHERSSSGCRLWGSACDSNSVDSLSFCSHGDCFADVGGSPKCVCDPGWSGDRCDSPIEWVQFAAGSAIEYSLNIALEQNTNDVELLFVPGRSSGSPELCYASNGRESFLSAFLDGQIASTKMEIWSPSPTIPATQLALNVSSLSLRDNGTYLMKIERNPTKAKLSVDGMFHSSRPLDPAVSPYMMDIKQLFLGASPGGHSGFSGCVGSFKWDRKALPLRISPLASSSLSTPSSLISVSSSTGVSDGCSLRVLCSQLPTNYCPSVLVCLDSWKGPICTCTESTNVLVNENGEAIGCGERLAVSSLGISSPAIILILVSLVALILLLLIVVFTSRRRSTVFDTVRPDEMDRDNARQYSVEGGGQSDNDQYSIDNLRKPVMPMEGMAPPIYPSDRFDDGLGRQIKDLENDQNGGPFDELRIYDDERDNVSMVTLESIDSLAEPHHRS